MKKVTENCVGSSTYGVNIYRYEFVSVCPNNGAAIVYALEIETDHAIYVEHIKTAAALHKQAFHEAIADDLFERFGGKQTLRAHHHGVDIETRREFEESSCGRLIQRVQVGTTVFEKGVEAIHAIQSGFTSTLRRITCSSIFVARSMAVPMPNATTGVRMPRVACPTPWTLCAATIAVVKRSLSTR